MAYASSTVSAPLLQPTEHFRTWEQLFQSKKLLARFKWGPCLPRGQALSHAWAPLRSSRHARCRLWPQAARAAVLVEKMALTHCFGQGVKRKARPGPASRGVPHGSHHFPAPGWCSLLRLPGHMGLAACWFASSPWT